jgi:NAD(P)-dependent dehydrogenase (short-subunit alcohol dehydrogenase family)
MSARELARAGHTVYAGIRDTAGRNAPAVADAAAFAAEQGADLRTVELDVADQVGARLAELAPPEADPTEVARAIVRVVGAPAGQRPFRVHVDPADDGAEVVNAVGDRVRTEFYRRIRLDDLLHVRA